jgi:hypothetical protein
VASETVLFQVAKALWDWIQEDVNTWLRALGDLKTVLMAHDLESDETVIYALRFSAFSVCAAILIGIPAQIIFYKLPALTQIGAVFILYYVVAFVFAICSKATAVLVRSKASFRACFMMALFAMVYWAPGSLIDYIDLSDLKVYRLLYLARVDPRQLDLSVWDKYIIAITAVAMIPIYSYVFVKMVSASRYVFKVGGLRATIIVLFSSILEQFVQVTILGPLFDALIKADFGS